MFDLILPLIPTILKDNIYHSLYLNIVHSKDLTCVLSIIRTDFLISPLILKVGLLSVRTRTLGLALPNL